MQFGTLNYAAHGGFCSVNMAAAGLYTFGGSFWEFGETDWDHTRYFMLFGVAEDHASNPLKIALGKLKQRGVKVVSVNPVRTGYNAIADEWIGIKPGTDGLFGAALVHELLRTQKIDLDYLVRYTNAPWLVIRDPGAGRRAVRARRGGNPVAFDRRREGLTNALGPDVAPALSGSFGCADEREAVPYSSWWRSASCRRVFARARGEGDGRPAPTIRRIAAELAHAAFQEQVLDVPWTDCSGPRHADDARPTGWYARDAGHLGSFEWVPRCRILHILQILLGVDRLPGRVPLQGALSQAAPPFLKPRGKPGDVQPRKPPPGPHLGFPTGPEICWWMHKARRPASTRRSAGMRRSRPTASCTL